MDKLTHVIIRTNIKINHINDNAYHNKYELSSRFSLVLCDYSLFLKELVRIIIMNTLGDRLKKLREDKKLSKGDLAELINIHYSQIGRYERNEASPSAEVLKNLANQLEVSTDFLMNGTLEQIADEAIKDKTLINQFNRISKLDDENKKIVISLIDAFLFKQEMKQKLAQ